MRKLSILPVVTLKGRQFRGLRGWSGKPLHPPLTDIPVAAYVFAAVFDLISYFSGPSHSWSSDFFHASTYVLVGGAFISLLAALTGFWDWYKSSEKGTQARRTINTHAVVMLTVTTIVIANIIWRVTTYGKATNTPVGVMILSVVASILVAFGATYGGSLVFDYGFNVETGGDHPVWHVSEKDVFPGKH